MTALQGYKNQERGKVRTVTLARHSEAYYAKWEALYQRARRADRKALRTREAKDKRACERASVRLTMWEKAW